MATVESPANHCCEGSPEEDANRFIQMKLGISSWEGLKGTPMPDIRIRFQELVDVRITSKSCAYAGQQTDSDNVGGVRYFKEYLQIGFRCNCQYYSIIRQLFFPSSEY